MNKVIIFFIIFANVVVVAKAQSNFWNNKNAYLSQPPPSDTPKIFAPKLLVPDSDTGIALDRVAFSNDGKEFYYCYNTTWFNTQNLKIKYFKYVDDEWKGPLVLNEQFNSPTFSIDGNTLYFPGGDSLSAVLWQSERTGDVWTKPSVCFRTKYSLYDLMPTITGTCTLGQTEHGESQMIIQLMILV